MSTRGRTRDPAVTSKIMAAVRRRDTAPELALRKALFARGLRYRISPKGVHGRPDVVFRGPRVAVFVDGDFWHGNAWRQRGDQSNEAMFSRWRNSAFWQEKIEANVARDRAADEALAAEGWMVVRIWETDLAADLDACVDRVVEAVRRAAERQGPARRPAAPRPRRQSAPVAAGGRRGTPARPGRSVQASG